MMARDDGQEVIFEVKVDYVQQDRQHQADIENRRVDEIVIRTLTVELPQELEHLFGVSAEINIKGTRSGSIIVFFAVVVTAYGVLSGYKGLVESVELIRDHARDLINIALSRFGDFNVSVSARYPSFRHSPFERDLVAALPYNAEYQPPQRDGFFYFLFAFSILELLVIAVLVGGAVVDKYF